MIVHCPSCETQFSVPDELYKPGRKARCSSCAHVFPLPELPGSAPAAPPEPVPPVEPAPVFSIPEPLEDDFREPDAPIYEETRDDDEKLNLPGKPKSKVKRVAVLAALLICLGAAGYGGYTFYKLWRSGGPPPAAPDTAQQELVKNLALANVRQYMVANNERVGRMAVVEGKVINNFTTPKELVRVEVTLYDDKGNVLATRQQYCGVVLSLFQLQVLSRDELTKALENRIEILMSNVNIKPGGEVPFMTVFFDPPQGALEFGVKIIDVKDPPPPSKK